MDDKVDFSKWSDAELARAEDTAHQFLNENHVAIWQSFSRQGAILQKLISVLRHPELTLEQRLDCFARIAEVSQGMQVSANGFFDLGSQPVVALMLASADLP